MSAARFLLNVPDLWDTFDLAGEHLARVRAQALAASTDPRERVRINDMFRQGREVTRAAREQGALLATGTATMYDEGVFLAYGMVFAVTTPHGQELTLPVLSRSLGVSADGDAPKDRVITAVQLPHVGTVARVTGTETTRLTADVDVELLTMHTMMPVPGRDRDYLVVTLASPNLPLKNEVHDLFDAITSTFRFLTTDGEQVAVAGAR
ncbi:hypothetical protein [Actinoplanes derwentensis]|uniref:Uncharacterized protein n=1 Tax=Actinoplanes derwentensis TaxID=113562 RepID=A0A1H2B984_9ACTN|nr:hypothetical protein [Actinoplanes derwentensis]GID86470.1 hypothetical protein Ade03nite_53940 [Actinoplanes derwentensis]SDT54753.1 hypothetical protein SAMN04489716_4438 [Actinoplanes derwentensis]